jgi:hypothetical protein
MSEPLDVFLRRMDPSAMTDAELQAAADLVAATAMTVADDFESVDDLPAPVRFVFVHLRVGFELLRTEAMRRDGVVLADEIEQWLNDQ